MKEFNEVVLKLWKDHAERLVFMVLALVLGAVMYRLQWVAEAKVIIIGIAMLCFNKARTPDNPEVKKDPGSTQG